MAEPARLSDEELDVLAEQGSASDLDRLDQSELKRLMYRMEAASNPTAAARKKRLEETPEGSFPTASGETSGATGFAEMVGQEYRDLPSAIANNRLGERIFSGEILDEIAKSVGVTRIGDQRIAPERRADPNAPQPTAVDKLKMAGSVAANLVKAPFVSAAETITNPSTQIERAPEETLGNLFMLGGLASKGPNAVRSMFARNQAEAATSEVAGLLRSSNQETGLTARPNQPSPPPRALPPDSGVIDVAEAVAARAEREASEVKRLIAMRDELPYPENQLPVSGGATSKKAIEGAYKRMQSERFPQAPNRMFGNESGKVQRGPLVTIGAGAAGAAAGAYVGSLIMDRQQENMAGTGAVIGGLLAAGGAKYVSQPNFREAVDTILQLGKQKGKEADFGKLIGAVIEPMLADRTIHVGAGLPIASTVGGAAAGAMLGSQHGEEFNVPGAIVGAIGGAAMGSHAASALAPVARAGFNPLSFYRQMFTEGRGLPEAVLQQRHAYMRRVAGRLGEIKDIFDVAKKFDAPTMNSVDEFLRGNAPIQSVPAAARDTAAAIRTTFDNLGRELVAVGLATGDAADTIMSNLGTYLPRLYLHHEMQDAVSEVARFARSRGLKLSDLEYLKARKDLPDSVRKALGEISSEFGNANPAFLLGKRAPITAADVEFAGYAKFIASSPDYALPHAAVPKNAGEVLEVGGKVYKKLAENRKLGFLKGRYVESAIADDLNTFIEAPSEFRKLLDAGTGVFKASKITMNPSTLARNVYGNVILADVIGGLSPVNVKSYARSFRNYLSRNSRYAEARAVGAFGGEWFGQEVGDLLKASGRNKTMVGAVSDLVIAAAGKPLSVMGRFHQATEQAFKMAVYDYARDVMKLSPAEAAAHAQKSLFDYRDVPRWIQLLRKSPIGAPFISFSYKALPRIFESALAVGTAGDPFGKFWRFWKYPLAMGAVNEYSSRKLDLIDDSEQSLLPTIKRLAKEAVATGMSIGQSPGKFGEYKNVLPDYIGNQQVLYPFRDQYGRMLMHDMTWTLPWGDVGEFGKGELGKQLAKAGIPFPRQLEPSNPWLQLTLGAWTGKDLFTGREIVQPNATEAEAASQFAGHTMRLFGPSWLPGGFAFDKVSRAVSGEYATDPNQPGIANALASEVFGVKVRPVDPLTSYRSKVMRFERQLAEKKMELSRARKMGASPEKLQEIEARIRDSVKRFKRQFGVASDYPPTPDPLKQAIQQSRANR